MKSSTEDRELDAQCQLCGTEGFKSDMIHTDDGYIVGERCCYDMLIWKHYDEDGESYATVAD